MGQRASTGLATLFVIMSSSCLWICLQRRQQPILGIHHASDRSLYDRPVLGTFQDNPDIHRYSFRWSHHPGK